MKNTYKSFVGKSLSEKANLFEERNKAYGDSYIGAGPVFKSFFPNGVELKTEMDFSRFALFVHLVTKMKRYAHNFPVGGHIDSLDDLSVYGQMLQEVDALNKKVK